MIELLSVHVTLAVMGIVWGIVTMLFPTRKKIFSLSALTTSVIATGAMLILYAQKPLGAVCASGLAYLACMGLSAYVSHQRLTRLRTMTGSQAG